VVHVYGCVDVNGVGVYGLVCVYGCVCCGCVWIVRYMCVVCECMEYVVYVSGVCWCVWSVWCVRCVYGYELYGYWCVVCVSGVYGCVWCVCEGVCGCAWCVMSVCGICECVGVYGVWCMLSLTFWRATGTSLRDWGRPPQKKGPIARCCGRPPVGDEGEVPGRRQELRRRGSV